MNLASGYIFLVLAIILGISSNGFLKATEGFTNIYPTILLHQLQLLHVFFVYLKQ